MARPRGSVNRNKRGLKHQLREAYGKDFNVVMLMGYNCRTLHDIAVKHKQAIIPADPEDVDYIPAPDDVVTASLSAKLAIDALEKLAQYVEPKLKAIEISGPEGEAVDMHWLIDVNEVKQIEQID